MKKHRILKAFACGLIFLISVSTYAGIFDKSEYAMRRQKLMDKIPDGIAVIRGAQLTGGYMDYYQNNNFMYSIYGKYW